MAFTLKINGTPHKVDVDGDTPLLTWPIATDDTLTANRRFRSIADMDRFSSRNDL